MFGQGRTLVMAVVNMTPDSFSDGGAWLSPDAAVARGQALIADGADLLDIGGESTRPGSQAVAPALEQQRILGAVAALAEAGATISVDTRNAQTARAAVAAGAGIINDVSGGTHDPAMYVAIAELGVPYVIQHMRGEPNTMNSLASYIDVVGEVTSELAARVEAALAAGIRPEQLILDPGLGFAKESHHNWVLLAHLDALQALGFPVLVGASRKRFLAEIVPAAHSANALEREHATTAVSALAAAAGAWAVRVHEARASRDAVRVASAWQAAR